VPVRLTGPSGSRPSAYSLFYSRFVANESLDFSDKSEAGFGVRRSQTESGEAPDEDRVRDPTAFLSPRLDGLRAVCDPQRHTLW
jgi:hypothetical protein